MAKIIVIEDIADSANLAKKILTKHGHDALVAHNGEEAIQYISATKFDLVLLDLGLPDVDGQTLLGMLRRNYDMEETPIIVCTAWPPDSARKMAEAYGFDGYLSKPYRVVEFMEVVSNFLSEG
jgi:DNA-binding response OmpR family regulator